MLSLKPLRSKVNCQTYSLNHLKNKLFFVILIFVSTKAVSQLNTNGTSASASRTAVPFLTITPDARSGALGETGVAIAADANSIYWNCSKLAFAEPQSAISVSYTPWMQKIIPSSYITFGSFYRALDARNTIGGSLRYFNIGTSYLYDNDQNATGVVHPNEFSCDIALARKFGENFSLGLAVRYIHSDLTTGLLTQGSQTYPANAAAADVSAYSKNDVPEFGNNAEFAWGINISNIGTKISYFKEGQGYFLPTNLKLGVANTWHLDEVNDVMLALDLNKLLVPTPPVRDGNGNIIKGEDDNISVPAGIFSSFTDAPGGFREQVQELNVSSGLEYCYARKYALRAGYHYENPRKGDLQYLTLGFGLKYENLKFDFAYIAASQQKSSLANTLRVSIALDLKDK